MQIVWLGAIIVCINHKLKITEYYFISQVAIEKQSLLFKVLFCSSADDVLVPLNNACLALLRYLLFVG